MIKMVEGNSEQKWLK